MSLPGLEDMLSLNAVSATELQMYDACLRWVDEQPDPVLDESQEDEHDRELIEVSAAADIVERNVQ